MSNISVTTNQTVIDVTQTSGIQVTTPEGQTITVTVPNSTVSVNNTTDDITILTAGTLNINTEGVVTSVNGDPGPAVVLTTSNINEGTNLYYTSTRANNDFDTRLATKTTTNLAEGTNLYYTTSRSNSDFDTRLATKTTDNLNEGTTNQYFTTARARQTISASDTGGLGSLSYDNSTGVITYTGASDAEVRALFTGGTGVTITTGTIAIGQAVGTADAVQFGSVQLDATAILDTATLTTSATTADQVVDSFSAAAYRTAKYVISVSSGTDYQAVEMLVVHNGTTATQTTYADVATNVSLATFAIDISAGLVRLLTTPVNAVTAYKVTRTAIAV
jgi:hypothetical protein